MFGNQVVACTLAIEVTAASGAAVPPQDISPAEIYGPDLVLRCFRVDLVFQGTQAGLSVRALRENPHFREGRQGRVGRTSCYGNRTGSG